MACRGVQRFTFWSSNGYANEDNIFNRVKLTTSSAVDSFRQAKETTLEHTTSTLRRLHGTFVCLLAPGPCGCDWSIEDYGCGCGNPPPGPCGCDWSIQDFGCGCGEPAPEECGCDLSIEDYGCGCGKPAPGRCGCDLSIKDHGCGCGKAAPGPCGCDLSIKDRGCGCGKPGPGPCGCDWTKEDYGCGCGKPRPGPCGCDWTKEDYGCGCGKPRPGPCGCDLSIEDYGCGCGKPAPGPCGCETQCEPTCTDWDNHIWLSGDRDKCIQYDSRDLDLWVDMGTCDITYDYQKWYFDQGSIKSVKDPSLCLAYKVSGHSRHWLYVTKCSGMSNEKWSYESNRIRPLDRSYKCVDLCRDCGDYLYLEKCESSRDDDQKFVVGDCFYDYK